MAGALTTLSEAESKALVARFGVPVPDERVVATADDAVSAADEIGYPVVVKLCGAAIAHKTERGLVRLRLRTRPTSRSRRSELLAAVTAEDGEVGVLVAPMVSGSRELIAGLNRDPQFGMTVMLGIGGVLAEAVADVTFRVVPIDRVDAREMIDDLRRSGACSARSAANPRSTASASPTCCSGSPRQRSRTRRSSPSTSTP